MTNRATVFVLDDDPAIQDALGVLLDLIDLRGEFYSTVPEFLSAFDPEKPGCLLLDLRLPGDGISLLTQHSARVSHLPVIVVTGHGGTSMRERALSLGASAFFEKPFDVAKLTATIQHAVSGTPSTQ